MMPNTARLSVTARKGLLVLALLYLAFAIYGSLVPLHFRPLPLEKAWWAFSNLRYLDLGSGSRTDWATNVLLPVPLAFFWQGVFWSRRILLRLLSAFLVWGLCIAFSLSIEFAQLFFPPRTASYADILAQAIGAGLGILAWWWKGPALWEWVLEWKSARRPAQLMEKLLWTYLAGLFGYNVLPLDLTVSPVEIYHKWAEGKVRLLPFATLAQDPAQQLYNLLTDVLLWVPVSALWMLSGRKGRFQAWRWTVLAAICLEGIQLFVYTRITDVMDILTAMLGAALGVWLAGYWQYRLPPTPRVSIRLIWGISAFLLWTVIVAVVFWYPFDFVWKGDFFRARLGAFSRVPFYSYFFGSEFRAATEVLHKVIFFAPLGVALALVRLTLQEPLFKKLFDVAALSALALVALTIELGQAVLPGKLPDSTDWILETLGGSLGYLGFLILHGRLTAAEPRPGRHPPANPDSARTSFREEPPGRSAVPLTDSDRLALPEGRSVPLARLPKPAPPSTRPGDDAARREDWLLALAVCCLGWMVYWSLAPLEAKRLVWEQGRHWFQVPAGWLELPTLKVWLGNLLLAAPTVFFWQGVIRQRLSGYPQGLGAALLWLGFTVIGFGIAYAQLFLPPETAPQANLLAQQGGIALGLLTGWWPGVLLPTALRLPHWRWRPAALLWTLPVLLLPLNPASALTDLAAHWPSSPGAYLRAVQSHIYYLYKGMFPWVPLGLFYVLAGRQRLLKVWVLAALAGFVLLGWPFFSHLQVRDVLEVAFVPLGVWAGVWIGERLNLPKALTASTATPGLSLPLRSATAPARAVARPEPALFSHELAPDPQAGSSAAVAALTPNPGGALSPNPPWPPEAGHADDSGAIALADDRPYRVWRRRALALGLLGLVAVGTWDYPRLGPWLSAALAGYGLLLWRFPYTWLLVVPAVLPVLDFAPWTGRFFWDEFDQVMLVTLAMAVWHGGGGQAGWTIPRPLGVALVLFGASCLISLLLGLLPLQPLDANAFSSYWSHYNSLRVAKGLGWALVILGLLRWGKLPDSAGLQRLFTAGMIIGLIGVVLIGLRERWQFAGLLDLARPYRIAASFSSMHTGGGHIEAYLVSAIPFLWLWVSGRYWLVKLAGMLTALLAAYVTMVTISRGGVLALGLGLLVLAIGTLRSVALSREARLRRVAWLAGLLGGVGLVAGIAWQGAYFQSRLAQVDRDWQTRLTHWADAVEMLDRDWSTWGFGMGLGRFPEIYLYRNPAGVLPATYRYEREDGNTFLRLGAGETLYITQRVPVSGGRHYTLSMDLRSRERGATLDTPVCERHLLDSFRCRWFGVDLPAGNGRWYHQEVAFSSGVIGSGNALTRRPVELTLYNRKTNTLVDVDNLRLTDDQGTELLANGDFSQGGDYWFFKTHNHLPWHIKNAWVQLLFEQGVLGLLAAHLLVGLVLAALGSALWRGNTFATVALASMTGFLTVGLFDSLFDTPRLVVLFFSVLWVGYLAAASGARLRRRFSNQHFRGPGVAQKSGRTGA